MGSALTFVFCSHWRSARAENDGALERLSTCLQDGSCGPGERNVVLLATFHFGESGFLPLVQHAPALN